MRPTPRSTRARYTATTAALLLCAAASGAQLEPPPEPAGNPVTVDKANLGKVLFWDEQISSTRTVACGTCHIPTAGGDDPRSALDPMAVNPGPDGIFGNEDDVHSSPGVPLSDAAGLYGWSTHFGLLEQVTPRRTTSALNAAYSPQLFWDGRAPDEFVDPLDPKTVVLPSGAALESQVAFPPVGDVEMAHVGRVWQDVLDRIAVSEPLALSPEVPTALIDWIDDRTYAELFQQAFGSPDITAPHVAEAIASYERTQYTDQTPFDGWLASGTGLTPQEVAGAVVFVSTAQCDNCHLQPLLTDNSFRYTGVRPQAEDPGLGGETGLPGDEGKMRVPSLRNLELRAPYMHNGRFDTITEVIDFYDRGGDNPGEPNLDPLIEPLNLTQQQKDDLLAFLGRPLTDPRVAAGQPPFDRPTLYTESSRVPRVTGGGMPGSGGQTPFVVALEPPLLGNPGFTVGVWNALGAADARLVVDDHDPGLTEPAPASGDLIDVEVVLQGSGAGAGFGSVSVALPADQALAGADWFGRWYVDDPGSGSGVAVSALLQLKTFAVQQRTAIFADGFESGDTSRWSSVTQ